MKKSNIGSLKVRTIILGGTKASQYWFVCGVYRIETNRRVHKEVLEYVAGYSIVR